MGFELCAEFALGGDLDEKAIDQIASGAGELKMSSWTTRAEILTTGLAWETPSNKSLMEYIRSGNAKKDKPQKGYPAVLSIAKTLDSFFPPQHGNSEQLDKSFITHLLAPRPDLLHSLPAGSLLLQATLTLKTPFFSKDDRPFYPHVNPLKRDKVFQVPCLAAAGVKGFLRWAWRMVHQATDKNKDPSEILAFGDINDDQGGRQGCVMFFPLFWQGSVGLEIINPVDRQSGAGRDPIKFEVVKPGATATLSLLIVNRWSKPDHGRMVARVLESLDWLLANSGLSAKRTADWGQVTASDWKAWVAEATYSVPIDPLAAKDKEWEQLCDADDNLLDTRNGQIFSGKIIRSLTGCSNKEVTGEMRSGALETLKQKHAIWKASRETRNTIKPVRDVSPLTSNDCASLRNALLACAVLQGGPHA